MKEKITSHEAKIISKDLPISFKQSVEVCRYITKKPLDKAKTILELVTKKKRAVPYKRYLSNIPHRKGKIATGRYPIKTVKHIIKLLNNVEANAEFKGLDTKNLFITKIMANKSGKQPRYGRRRRNMKRTNIEIHVAEKETNIQKKGVNADKK